MSSQISQNPPIPLYYQVRVAIQGDIAEGRLKPGDMLPSEKILCDRYGVSSITVRRALRDLVHAGLIYRENGVGTFVAQPTRHYSVALIFCGFSEHGWRQDSHMFGALIGSVGQAIWERGATLSVSNVASPEVLIDAIRQIAENSSFDGLLIRADVDLPAAVALSLTSLGVPYVLIKKKAVDVAVNTVWMDNRAHACMACEHLLGLGHRRVGLVSGAPESRATQDRILGYGDAYAAFGLQVDSTLIYVGESEFADVGYAGTIALLTGCAPPTALVIAVDQFVPSVYAAIGDRGLRIPEEISLVGFAETGRGPMFRPPLTTLAITDFDLGQESADLLIELIEARVTPPVAREIAPQLIVRETSAPPPDRC
ncbi:MAG: GntR family transcriptional regulator [Thermomicrobiales bacterium]